MPLKLQRTAARMHAVRFLRYSMDTNKTQFNTSPIVVSTIGYEGRSCEGFIAELTGNEVQMVIDVRQRAGSRRRGFAKTALADMLTKAGIDYIHLPQLGTPPELRTQLRDGDITRVTYLAKYRRYVKNQSASFAELERLIADQHCCLLCLEASHRDCHRSCLASIIAERSVVPLVVRHL